MSRPAAPHTYETLPKQVSPVTITPTKASDKPKNNEHNAKEPPIDPKNSFLKFNPSKKMCSASANHMWKKKYKRSMRYKWNKIKKLEEIIRKMQRSKPS